MFSTIGPRDVLLRGAGLLAVAAPLHAQQQDVISRVHSVWAGSAIEMLDVVSREYTVFAPPVPVPGDVISREYSAYALTPDLVLEDVVVPLAGNAGEEFLVIWTTRNVGSAEVTGTWGHTLAFSTQIDPVGSTGPATSFAFPGVPLVQGASMDVVAGPFLYPDILVQTDFTLTITADSGGQVIEEPYDTAEANNIFGPATVTVYPIPRPDLAITFTQEPPPSNGSGGYDAGDALELAFRVANVGEAATNLFEWTDRIYLVPAPGGVPPADEAEAVASWSFDSVSFLQYGTGSEPGTFYDRVVDVADDLRLPVGVFGQHALVVKADAEGELLEPSEVDNVAVGSVFTIDVPPHPDLEPSALAVELSAGETFLNSGFERRLTWDLTNIDATGTSPAANVVGQVFLSTNDLADTSGDLYLGQTNAAVPSIPPLGSFPGRELQARTPARLNLDLPSTGDLYHFKVVEDATNVVAELDPAQLERDGNNVAVSPAYEIRLAPTPDLVADAIDLAAGQGEVLAGHVASVTWTVRNIGSPGWDQALSWTDEVWLANDPDLGMATGSWLLGAFAQSATQVEVEPGVFEWRVLEYTKTRSVMVPTAVPAAASYYLVLRTDTGDSVFEYDTGSDAEGNNEVGSVAPFPIDRRPADLGIVAQAGSDLPPALAAPGQTVLLPWTVTNTGAGPTNVGTWQDRVYLSKSSTGLDQAALVVSVDHAPGLAPGGSYEVRRSVQVPYVQPGGDWYLLFYTDWWNQVFQDGETEPDLVAVAFEVTDVIANLEVQAVAAMSQMKAGEPLIVDWTVINSGPAATGASSWLDRVYLADLMDLGQANQVVTLGSVPRTAALAGGSATYDASGAFGVPITLAPGPWYVVVETDADQRVFEADETDNQRSIRSQIVVEAPPPANLVVTDVQAPASPVIAGQSLAVTWQVTNEGAGTTNTAGWTDSIWLSLDHNIDPLDVYLGYATHTTILGPGEMYPGSASFIVPLWVEGSFVLLVRTNSNGAVYQAGATPDDVGFDADTLVHVVAPALTDLEIASASFPATVELGATLPISWATRNQSMSDVPVDWSWSDDVWIVPDGVPFPNPSGRSLGRFVNLAGGILAGATTPEQAATPPPVIPGVHPGTYTVIVRSDVLNQIFEVEEGLANQGDDNVFVAGSIELEAIPIAAGDPPVERDFPNGTSRWLELSAPADVTVELAFSHTDPDARCELYVREGTVPTLGVYDLASEGIDTFQANVQTVRIPQTSGGVYYVLARAVDGVDPMTPAASLSATAQPFLVETVAPERVGAGDVTLELDGFELVKAQSVVLRLEGGGLEIGHEPPLVLTSEGRLLARFGLAGAPFGAYEVVAIDTSTQEEATWSGLLTVEALRALSLGVELDVSPSVRRGETGRLQLTLFNEGNVNLPFSTAVLGQVRPGGVSLPQERIVVGSAQLGLPEIETTGVRDSLVVFVEDLGPSQRYTLDLEAVVGPDWIRDTANVTVAGAPWDATSFLAVDGFLGSLSEELRMAVTDDPGSQSDLLDIASVPGTWEALVFGALGGSLVVDEHLLFDPTVESRCVRTLLESIAAAVFLDAGLPPGAEVPLSSINAVAARAWCAPFSGGGYDCDQLFPPECGDDPARASITIVQGGNVPTGRVCFETKGPDDPNEKVPPRGIGSMNMIAGDDEITYRIHFENQAGAGAWASLVTIEDQLEPPFRGASLRFEEIRIGENLIALPARPVYLLDQRTIQVNEETQSLVQISAGLDAQTDTIRVVLQALDPATGLPPISGSQGLLPPDDEAFAGQATGYVEFSIRPDENYAPETTNPAPPSGTRMRNRASIQFNDNPPLLTGETLNVLDSAAPTSSLTIGPPSPGRIPLSWNADDGELTPTGPFEGSGVASYSLSFATSPDGPFLPYLTDTELSGTVFRGQPGKRYWLKVEARDRVGNREVKAAADGVAGVPLFPRSPRPAGAAGGEGGH